MDRQELQARRGENQVWNGSGNYAVKPDYLAFDPNGDPELYWNTVTGAAARRYDFTRFQPLLHAFQQQPQGDAYAEVFFLALESAVYVWELPRRPVLASLRYGYARALLERTPAAEPRTLPSLRRAWCGQVLGLAAPEDDWQRGFLDALSLPPETTETQLIEAVEAALYRYMNRPRRAVTDRQWAAFAGRSLLRRGKSGGLVQPNALRGFARTPAAGSGQLARPGLLAFLRGVTPEPVLRRYVTDCFGVSMLTPAELAQAERELCTGPHQNCRLHFTRGEPSKTARSGDAAWDAQSFQKQREKNRAYYNDHLVQNRLVISQLTQKLQNTLLLRSDTDQSRSRAGALRSDIVWRAAALDDARVFTRTSQEHPGGLSVDILLDGSASQNQQQEKLSTQAYILSESLTRCGIPVRVTAFCSVSGCTVLRVLWDYGQRSGDGVFDYVAAGWNRDGLALRAMNWLLRRQPLGDRSLLLVLSDASPNDDQPIPLSGLPVGGHGYTGERGIADTAAEAARLRLQGVTPVCIFTGTDREVPAARRIYGAAMTRIPSVGWFADAVTKLLQDQLRKE